MFKLLILQMISPLRKIKSPHDQITVWSFATRSAATGNTAYWEQFKKVAAQGVAVQEAFLDQM